jgi:hypothetical protein
LGCPEGRSAKTWVDFNLFGHQVVCHEVHNYNAATTANAVGEDPELFPLVSGFSKAHITGFLMDACTNVENFHNGSDSDLPTIPTHASNFELLGSFLITLIASVSLE